MVQQKQSRETEENQKHLSALQERDQVIAKQKTSLQQLDQERDQTQHELDEVQVQLKRVAQERDMQGQEIQERQETLLQCQA